MIALLALLLATCLVQADATISGPITVSGYAQLTGFVPPPTVAPSKATTPSPSDTAINQVVNGTLVLSWADGGGAANYDVHFGTVNPPPFVQNQSGTTYNPGGLLTSQTYYWRIDSKNAAGTTTGDVWSFTTKAPIVVDMFIDMESGNVGDLVTTNILNTVTHGLGANVWTTVNQDGGDGITLTNIWVSNQNVLPLYTPVQVGATVYNDASASRSHKKGMRNQFELCFLRFSAAHSNVTVAGFLNIGLNNDFSSGGFNHLDVQGGSDFGAIGVRDIQPPPAVMETHFGDGPDITLTEKTTYWFCLNYATNAMARLAFFNVNTHVQIGQTSTNWIASDKAVDFRYGRVDSHGDDTSSDTPAYFRAICIQFDGNAIFPLGP